MFPLFLVLATMNCNITVNIQATAFMFAIKKGSEVIMHPRPPGRHIGIDG